MSSDSHIYVLDNEIRTQYHAFKSSEDSDI